MKNQTIFQRNISTIFQNLTIHRRSTNKRSWNNIITCRFLKGVWFHTQRKDGANNSIKLFSKRNWYFARTGRPLPVQMMITLTTLTYCWNLTRKYIGNTSIHYLPRLRTTNINRSKKMVRHKNAKKQTISSGNSCWCRLRGWFSTF